MAVPRPHSFEAKDAPLTKSNSNSDGGKNKIELELRSGTFLASTDRACDPCRQRKIRCDRVSPNCVNCQRCNLACSYSDRARRGHSVKKLAESFEEFETRVKSLEAKTEQTINTSNLEGRLERIEDSLEHAISTLEALNLQAEQVTRAVRSGFTPERSPLDGSQSPTTSADNGFSAREIGFVDQGGDAVEKYRGSCSMLSLMRDATCGQSFSAHQQVNEEFNQALLVSAGGPSASILLSDGDYTRTGRPVSLPSEALVNALLRPFLEDVNSIFPVFDNATISNQVRNMYTSPPDNRSAVYCLAMNCLVSHTLSARCRSKIHDSSDRMADAELLRPFVNSITQSFSMLGEVLKPSLLNVQALVTLCVLCLDNFPIKLAEHVLEQACSCATSMGLHRRGRRSENDLERQNLFWTLFIIDKNLSFLLGKPARLPAYDCDVPLQHPEQGDLSQRFFSCRARLVIIQEQIYSSLYSAGALRQSDLTREKKVTQLTDKLHQWRQEHDDLLSKTEFLFEEEPMQHVSAELSILCSMYGIMIRRTSRTATNMARCLQESRDVMDALYNLAQRTELRGKEAALRRILESAAFASFSEILGRLLRSDSVEIAFKEDVQRLNNSVEILQFITRLDSPHTYCSQLWVICSRHTQLLNVKLENRDTPSPSNPKKRRIDHDDSLDSGISMSNSLSNSMSNSMSNWELSTSLSDEKTMPPMHVSDPTLQFPSITPSSEVLVTPTADDDMMKFFGQPEDAIWDREWITGWPEQDNCV